MLKIKINHQNKKEKSKKKMMNKMQQQEMQQQQEEEDSIENKEQLNQRDQEDIDLLNH